MFVFLVPLLIGFTCNSASAFTTFYSQRLGQRAGRLICVLLRDVLGIPVWAAGYALAARSSTSTLFNPGLVSAVMAWIVLLLGVVIICAGLWSLRWRAAAPTLQDKLVTSGVYAHIRHPLYSGLLLELVGLFLWVPTLPMSLACVLGVLWTMLQARLEELDLLQRLPAYRDYMQQVPRFLPKFKLG